MKRDETENNSQVNNHSIGRFLFVDKIMKKVVNSVYGNSQKKLYLKVEEDYGMLIITLKQVNSGLKFEITINMRDYQKEAVSGFFESVLQVLD